MLDEPLSLLHQLLNFLLRVLVVGACAMGDNDRRWQYMGGGGGRRQYGGMLAHLGLC